MAGNDEVILLVFRHNAGIIRGTGLREHVVSRTDRQVAIARFLESVSPYRATWAERALSRLRPDVVFFPQHALFPKRVAAPVVVTVLDLQHLVFPENFSWVDRLFRAGIYRYSVRHADRVITISEATQQSVLDCYGGDPARITPILLGFDARERGHMQPIYPLPQKYWYYPAATLPHKNHLCLFRTWAQLHDAKHVADSLVLSGIRTPYWRQLEREIRRLELANVITHLGYLDDGQVATVYSQAKGVLFPSLFEGFGLPVVEAAEWNKKVLVSPLDVYRELGVPDDSMVDFSDAEAVWRAMQAPGPTRLGEEVTHRIDVRIIAATNRDLKKEIEAGRFRRDLYYRLAVFPIEVAPLRQHKEDIPLLAAHFLDEAAASFNRSRPRLTEANIIHLQQYDWPGNVRELRNVIERAVIVSRGDTLHFDLTLDWRQTADSDDAREPGATAGAVLSDLEMKHFERDNLLAALRQSNWKIYGPGGAAELMGMRPTTLLSRIKKFGLEKPRRQVKPR